METDETIFYLNFYPCALAHVSSFWKNSSSVRSTRGHDLRAPIMEPVHNTSPISIGLNVGPNHNFPFFLFTWVLLTATATFRISTNILSMLLLNLMLIHVSYLTRVDVLSFINAFTHNSTPPRLSPLHLVADAEERPQHR